MGMPAPSEKADDVSLNDMVVLPCDVCCAESRAGAGASADELSAAFGAPWLQAPASNARTILNTGVFIIGVGCVDRAMGFQKNGDLIFIRQLRHL